MADELHLFDFDGTLFRSPDPPPWWDKGSWAYHPQSMDPPCVPARPGPEWWISSAVAAAKRAIGNPDVYAVLATGRADKKFRWRVPELLKQKGLNFDEVHLNPGKDTGAFKRALLTKVLKRYPNIEVVRMWDDRKDLLAGYAKMLEGMGYEVVSHPVQAPRQQAICPDPVKIARAWLRRTSSASTSASCPLTPEDRT